MRETGVRLVVGSSGAEVFFEGVEGVAIVGASSDPLKAGHQIVRNMADAGFPGKVFPINPHGAPVAGYPGHRALAGIPERVDLVVIAAPAAAIEHVVPDLEDRFRTRGDVRGVITTAAGFAETGTPEGRARQEALLGICRRYGVREIGPNCVGIIDNANRLDTTFIQGTRRRAGGVSMVSQSGAFGAWMVARWSAQPAPAGVSKFCSLGNMADLDLIELLDYLDGDSLTRVVGVYLEGHEKARDFVRTAGRVARAKPVVVLKVGRTAQGSEAAHSHTGSMAGSDRVYSAAFRDHGIVRVDSADELTDTLQAFDRLPPSGPRVFLATQAGGPGAYCMDFLAAGGGAGKVLRLATVSRETREALVRLLPPFASVCRPEGHCDMTAAATVEQHARAVELLLSDPGVDALIMITVPTLYLDVEELGRAVADAYRRASERAGTKPLLTVILAGDVVRSGRRILEDSGLPTFETPDRAVRALANLVRYRDFLKGGGGDGEWGHRSEDDE